ncbi:hypothetical protein FHL15_010685 [Xylaria flabelliformis]|uniref:Uncharacterized protein n=1 Tax=Xylaria flabelliformis TaxID=2512241 RepID=A0A553HKG3_9PEZI|nr:hypothetical protein FHL15_010685 [Xylaria flabelliformis]
MAAPPPPPCLARLPPSFRVAHHLLHILQGVHPFVELDITDDRLEILGVLFSINLRIAALDLRIAAVECNYVSRQINKGINDPAALLVPLHAITTNLPIANFPRTSIDIALLDAEASLTSILVQLEQPLYGDEVAKRRRLIVHVGAINIVYN